jgi:dihydropyrimidinase
MTRPSCDLLVKNGTLVTGSFEGPSDVAVRSGRVWRTGRNLGVRARTVINAAGRLVLPGCVDMHVHFGIPMFMAWCTDDPDSGSRAALMGGVTTAADFTLPQPGHGPMRTLEERFDFFSGRSWCDYTFHLTLDGAATRRFDFMKEAGRFGVRTFKIFTCYGASGMMTPADRLPGLFRRSVALGGLVLIHAEDEALMQRRRRAFIRGHKTAPRFHALSRPAEAELLAVKRCLRAASASGANMPVVHLTTGAAARLIAAARLPAGAATCETGPQYLLLDDGVYRGPDAAQFMVSPPLRPRSHRDELRRELLAGNVQALATDHCPFYSTQKRPPGKPLAFHEIQTGLPGVETTLRLMFTWASAGRRMDRRHLVRLLSENPARLLGLYPQKGTLEPGSDADVVIYDPRPQDRIRARDLHMRTDFSPYEGMKVRGRVRTVILRGRPVVQDGRLALSSPCGTFIPQRPYAW